jgi:hypothetical protein
MNNEVNDILENLDDSIDVSNTFKLSKLKTKHQFKM